MYATTPHMFAPGLEQDRYRNICDLVKRPLYGADCYAYALVASGFGADLVVEADLGLYDYCALVPVVEGAGGVMSDWEGRRLTLTNHSASKGRVIAAANKALMVVIIIILMFMIILIIYLQWFAGSGSSSPSPLPPPSPPGSPPTHQGRLRMRR